MISCVYPCPSIIISLFKDILLPTEGLLSYNTSNPEHRVSMSVITTIRKIIKARTLLLIQEVRHADGVERNYHFTV